MLSFGNAPPLFLVPHLYLKKNIITYIRYTFWTVVCLFTGLHPPAALSNLGFDFILSDNAISGFQ